MYACFYGHMKIVRMFVEYYEVDTEKLDKNMKNGFIIACKSEKTEVIKYLLYRGVNINHKDKYGKTGYDYFDK